LPLYSLNLTLLSRPLGKLPKKSLGKKENGNPLLTDITKGFERLSNKTDGVTQNDPVSFIYN
jgi:hypothetical protein